tara:strand:- start:20868 stop:21941 length:1074 start_codon:yes stop_codon:yes gene_type:complete
MIFLHHLFKLLSCIALLFAAQYSLSASPAEIGQWGAAMGQSGLRRFYATGSDLGELVNRQLSYQLAARTGQAKSEVDSYVLQWDSLLPIATDMQQPVFIRALARTAKRFEPDKLHGRNDRFDLGLVYAPTLRSYVSFGLGLEHTDDDIKFVEGTTDGFAAGPRFDAGIVFSDTLALGMRLEELKFDGDNRIEVFTPGGLLEIEREIENRRRFFKSELLGRYNSSHADFIPARTQLGWMAGIQYLDTRYERKINSLGQPVNEPFGNRERLGIARAGIFTSYTFGHNNNWNASVEYMLDHEFDTNMATVINDRNNRYLRAGLAYIVGPGKRIQFDYQGFHSTGGSRGRNNFSIIAVIDF